MVGGGISGLAAAFFFRARHGSKGRILILDNHDDFGGHAKRDEFRHGGRLLIGYGGTQSIDGPSGYSPQAAGLLRNLGIDVQRFHAGVRPEAVRVPGPPPWRLLRQGDLRRGSPGEGRRYLALARVPGPGTSCGGRASRHRPPVRRAGGPLARLHTRSDEDAAPQSQLPRLPRGREDERPWVRGRRRFGSIAIANSDAGASAFTNVAIDQAFRAVEELSPSE